MVFFLSWIQWWFNFHGMASWVDLVMLLLLGGPPGSLLIWVLGPTSSFLHTLLFSLDRCAQSCPSSHGNSSRIWDGAHLERSRSQGSQGTPGSAVHWGLGQSPHWKQRAPLSDFVFFVLIFPLGESGESILLKAKLGKPYLGHLCLHVLISISFWYNSKLSWLLCVRQSKRNKEGIGTCFLTDGIWEQMTKRRQVSQLLLKGKKWLSLPKTEIFILGSVKQMWSERNVDVKIVAGGKRAIYCFWKIFNGRVFFYFKGQFEIEM